MAFFIVKVGDWALGAYPLYALTDIAANYQFFTTAAAAEAGRLAALEKYPNQSFDGYVIEPVEAKTS